MSTGLLGFFVLEGSECVEQLDELLARAETGTPDLELFARNARALRGSATMAKVQGITDVALALERVAKGLRDGSLQWTPQLRGAAVAAIDDLKILIRRVRVWGRPEDARAARCAKELGALAPAPERAMARTPVAGAGSAAFLAFQTADVAVGLQRFADAPGPIAAFAETLFRLRALRGVAALLDLPPLAEVVAAVDDAAKGLEIGSITATEALRELFRTAAVALREGSDAIRAGDRPDPGTSAVFAFTVAAQSFVEGVGGDEQIVPIHTLFPDGGADHVVRAEANPPTTPAQRFKFEVVSHAEHLRRLVGDARRAADAPSRQRLGHELRGAIVALARSADSFGEYVIATSLSALTESAAALDPAALTGLDDAAALLASRADEPLAPRIAKIVARATPERAAASVGGAAPSWRPAPEATKTPVHAPTPVRTATPAGAAPPVRGWTPLVPTPVVPVPLEAALSGDALHDLLGAGITGLSSLGDTPLAEPADIEDDGMVPIQDLLYRGRGALHRASQLGQSFRRAGSTPDAEGLAELFDLLELAETE